MKKNNLISASKISLLTKEGQSTVASADTSGTSGKSFLDNAKWKIIALLAILLIAILFSSLILFFMQNNVNSNKYDGFNYQNQNFSNLTLTTNEFSITNYNLTTTTALTAATMRKIFTTFSPQIDNIQMPTQSKYNSICEIPKNFVSKCSVNNQNSAENLLKIKQSVSVAEYILNISITNRNEQLLTGSVEFQFHILNSTKTIALYASSYLRFIDEKKIIAFECSDKNVNDVCIEKVTRFFDKELILITFFNQLTRSSEVRLQIKYFETELSNNNPAFVLQQPLKWERDRAWIVGTYNPQNLINNEKNDLLHSVFPEIATHNNDKIVFKLCLNHPKDAIARSNAPKRVLIEIARKTTTCFEETPKILIENFAFVIFDNMRSIALEKDFVEVFVGKHLSADDSQWILDETVKVLNQMTSITQSNYSIKKLTLISSPLSLTDGTAALGLIHIKETWLEYPKYFYTHNVLVAQIVRQWISNMITFCDKCFQDGLVTYLEWEISAELNSKVATVENADDFSGNVTRRFFEVRNRLMQSRNIVANLFTNDLKSINNCADRIAVILFMLRNTYSSLIMQKFFSLITRYHVWQNKCVTNSQLSLLFRQSNDNSEISQQMFDSFISPNTNFENDNKTIKKIFPPPLVYINLNSSSGLLTISQKNASQTKTIPINIVDNLSHRTQLIFNNSEISTLRAVKYVIAEPNSYVRHIYNPENYATLLECYSTSNCLALSLDALTNAFNDLCWALMSNQLDQNIKNETSTFNRNLKWYNIFNNLSRHKDAIRDFDCACCMQRRSNSKAQCRWTWRDKCSKIILLKNKE